MVDCGEVNVVGDECSGNCCCGVDVNDSCGQLDVLWDRGCVMADCGEVNAIGDERTGDGCCGDSCCDEVVSS